MSIYFFINKLADVLKNFIVETDFIIIFFTNIITLFTFPFRKMHRYGVSKTYY